MQKSALPVKQLCERDYVDPEIGIHYIFHNTVQPTRILHCHDYYEFFFVVKGGTVHHINNNEEELTAGALVFIRPSDIHCFQPVGQMTCHYFNLVVSAHSMELLFNYLGAGFPSNELINAPIAPSALLSETESKMLLARLNQLHAIPLTNKQKKGTAYRIVVADIITKSFGEKHPVTREEMPDWLSRLCAEMEAKENLVDGLPALRRLSGRSAEQVCRVFQQYLGVTPTEYVNELRLNYMANLLINTDKDILSISLECGFSNLSHLYHLFKDKFHMPPAMFRKKHQKVMSL